MISAVVTAGFIGGALAAPFVRAVAAIAGWVRYRFGRPVPVVPMVFLPSIQDYREEWKP